MIINWFLFCGLIVFNGIRISSILPIMQYMTMNLSANPIFTVKIWILYRTHCWNLVPVKPSEAVRLWIHITGWWYTYPSEKWWSESQLGFGIMKFPISGKINQMFQSTNQIKNPYCLLLQHIHITLFSESYTLGILCGQSFPFNPRPLP